MENPLHIIGFLSQWKIYLDQLPTDPDQPFTGRKLDPGLLEKVSNTTESALACRVRLRCRVVLQMSSEQIGQLYELMHATEELWKPAPSSEEADAFIADAEVPKRE